VRQGAAALEQEFFASFFQKKETFLAFLTMLRRTTDYSKILSVNAVKHVKNG
jgi:hypothetical protein